MDIVLKISLAMIAPSVIVIGLVIIDQLSQIKMAIRNK